MNSRKVLRDPRYPLNILYKPPLWRKQTFLALSILPPPFSSCNHQLIQSLNNFGRKYFSHLPSSSLYNPTLNRAPLWYLYDITVYFLGDFLAADLLTHIQTIASRNYQINIPCLFLRILLYSFCEDIFWLWKDQNNDSHTLWFLNALSFTKHFCMCHLFQASHQYCEVGRTLSLSLCE